MSCNSWSFSTSITLDGSTASVIVSVALSTLKSLSSLSIVSTLSCWGWVNAFSSISLISFVSCCFSFNNSTALVSCSVLKFKGFIRLTAPCVSLKFFLILLPSSCVNSPELTFSLTSLSTILTDLLNLLISIAVSLLLFLLE